ncbi:MAG TPA: hypothetical protein VL134_09430 [Leptolyngbya sp.]|jgi:serine/threonine-protein kinase|nr:hypothetical protein [Leptolyngbya sp.]
MQTPLPINSVLVDRYCVLKLLHQGATGWVYLSIDQMTKGVCVLEEISPIDSSAVSFLQEQFAELLTGLKSQQVAQYQGTVADFDRFYLVRDYVEGHSYRELLEQGRIFSEQEVLRFLKQILWILRSLHRREIAHHNLSLNSIIQRLDGSLMLAEFTQASFVDREFDVDLHTVAVIAIVLLTGCEPKELYDEMTQAWKWRDRIVVQPRLAQVLDRMLSRNPKYHYSSAPKVLQALFAPHQPDFAAIVFTFVLIALAAISAYRLINHLSNLQPALVTPSTAVDAAPTPKETIQPRSQRLKRQDQLLSQLLSQISKESGQPLEKLLDQLEPLSQESRSGMGTYKRTNYNAWLSKSDISDRAISILTDAQFVARFPDQKGNVLNPRTFGQIWYAIARDQTTQIQSETFSSSANGTLNNGVGKVYRSQFKQGQTLKLKRSGDAIAVWIFSGDSMLLKNFTQSNWSGKVSRSGTYEIVIVPNTTQTAQYDLQLTSSTSR